MSLESLLFTSPVPNREARRIGRELSSRCGFTFSPCTSWLRGTCGCFFLPDVDRLLTDEADWDAQVWDMHAEELPRLAEAIRAFVREMGRSSTFRVAWTGEDTIRQETVELPDLIRIILAGEIGNRVDYVVENPNS